MTASSVGLEYCRNSSGISDLGGGSDTTVRDSTTTPMPLSAITSSHVTGPPPISQVSSPSTVSRPKAPGAPRILGELFSLIDSAIPETVTAAWLPAHKRLPSPLGVPVGCPGVRGSMRPWRLDLDRFR